MRKTLSEDHSGGFHRITLDEQTKGELFYYFFLSFCHVICSFSSLLFLSLVFFAFHLPTQKKKKKKGQDSAEAVYSAHIHKTGRQIIRHRYKITIRKTKRWLMIPSDGTVRVIRSAKCFIHHSLFNQAVRLSYKSVWTG